MQDFTISTVPYRTYTDSAIRGLVLLGEKTLGLYYMRILYTRIFYLQESVNSTEYSELTLFQG